MLRHTRQPPLLIDSRSLGDRRRSVTELDDNNISRIASILATWRATGTVREQDHPLAFPVLAPGPECILTAEHHRPIRPGQLDELRATARTSLTRLRHALDGTHPDTFTELPCDPPNPLLAATDDLDVLALLDHLDEGSTDTVELHRLAEVVRSRASHREQTDEEPGMRWADLDARRTSACGIGHGRADVFHTVDIALPRAGDQDPVLIGDEMAGEPYGQSILVVRPSDSDRYSEWLALWLTAPSV